MSLKNYALSGLLLLTGCSFLKTEVPIIIESNSPAESVQDITTEEYLDDLITFYEFRRVLIGDPTLLGYVHASEDWLKVKVLYKFFTLNENVVGRGLYKVKKNYYDTGKKDFDCFSVHDLSIIQ